jgi:hypothetical protein
MIIEKKSRSIHSDNICIRWNLSAYYRVQKGRPCICPKPYESNLHIHTHTHTHTCYFCKIHLNILIPSTAVPFKLSDLNCLCFPYLTRARYILCPYPISSFLFDQKNIYCRLWRFLQPLFASSFLGTSPMWIKMKFGGWFVPEYLHP